MQRPLCRHRLRQVERSRVRVGVGRICRRQRRVESGENVWWEAVHLADRIRRYAFPAIRQQGGHDVGVRRPASNILVGVGQRVSRHARNRRWSWRAVGCLVDVVRADLSEGRRGPIQLNVRRWRRQHRGQRPGRPDSGVRCFESEFRISDTGTSRQSPGAPGQSAGTACESAGTTCKSAGTAGQSPGAENVTAGGSKLAQVKVCPIVIAA